MPEEEKEKILSHVALYIFGTFKHKGFPYIFANSLLFKNTNKVIHVQK
jgi:hypothetical protein